MGNSFKPATAPFFVCSKKSSSHSKSKKYRHIETRVSCLPCDYCNLVIDIKIYNTHLQSCPLRPKNIKVNCEYCHMTFDLQAFGFHTGTCQENPENVELNCTFCKKNFNAITIIPHIENCGENPRNKRLACEFCTTVVTGDFYEKHKRDCGLNPDNAEVTCQFCKKEMIVREHRNHVKECEAEYKKREEQKSQDKQCCICFEQMENPKDVTFILCFHRFHTKCINSWSRVQNFCPICRVIFA